MSAAVPKTEQRGGSESRGRGELGAGQEGERLAPPARSVFPSRAGAVGRGLARLGSPLRRLRRPIYFTKRSVSVGLGSSLGNRPAEDQLLLYCFKNIFENIIKKQKREEGPGGGERSRQGAAAVASSVGPTELTVSGVGRPLEFKSKPGPAVFLR